MIHIMHFNCGDHIDVECAGIHTDDRVCDIHGTMTKRCLTCDEVL